jgi:hypothetical protein
MIASWLLKHHSSSLLSMATAASRDGHNLGVWLLYPEIEVNSRSLWFKETGVRLIWAIAVSSEKEI